jgi:dTDP-4-amino-4,6-dideoxy-D-glucose transaminase
VTARGSIRKSPSEAIQVTRPSLPPLAEYEALLPRLWSSGTLTNGGPYVRELEGQLGRYLPARHVRAVTNGTLALQLALRAVGGSKGVVITTPFTFAATTTALVWQGFTPAFVDIDRETFILDPALVADRIRRDVVGVLPVQVFGNTAGSRELAAVAKERSRWAVFDAAHSFGVRSDHGPLFDRGDASILSFHATKSFHTFEGGGVVTPSRRVAQRVERLRNFGLLDSGDVSDPGINAKMTESQAAMGLVNLRHVDRWIRERGSRAKLYRDLLASSDEVQFQRVESARQNFIYMPVLLPNRRLRDRVYRHLYQNGIRARRYFFPLTSQFAFVPKALRGKCPVAVEIANRVLCLPLYQELPLGEVRRIVGCLQEGLR